MWPCKLTSSQLTRLAASVTQTGFNEIYLKHIHNQVQHTGLFCFPQASDKACDQLWKLIVCYVVTGWGWQRTFSLWYIFVPWQQHRRREGWISFPPALIYHRYGNVLGHVFMLQWVADVLFNVLSFCFHKAEYIFSRVHFHMHLAQVNPTKVLALFATAVNTKEIFYILLYP